MSLCKAGRPVRMTHDGADAAVLLIHGYTGYPGELTRPARDLYAVGFDVYVPRLPGHGTNGEDFARSTERDWLEEVLKEAGRLRKEYRELYLLGHSMGAALAVIASGKVPVDRLILAAPAVSAPGQKKPVNMILLWLLSKFRKRSKTAWVNDPGYVMYYEDAPLDDLYLGSEYWAWVYYRQLYGLLSLMDKARERAAAVSVPTLIIGAGQDQLMGLGGAEYLSRAIKNSKYVVIPGATHYLFYDKDKKAEEEAVQSVLSWVGEKQ